MNQEKSVDIIIPAYNAHNTIEKTLASIAMQVNSEVCNVTIINDNSDKDYSDIISTFKNLIDIDVIDLPENIGPGSARQYGIDHTNLKYILFVDADDMLYEGMTLKSLLTEAQNGDFNVVFGAIKEQRVGGTMWSLDIPADHWTWIFGSLYKRDFIESSGIRFNNSTRGEDVAFNKLVKLLSPQDKIKFLDRTTYLWTDLNKSGRFNNTDFMELYSKIGYVENILDAYRTIKKMGEPSKEFFKYDILSSLVSMYFQLKQLQDVRPNDVPELLNLVQEFYNEMVAPIIDSASIYDIQNIYDVNLRRFFPDPSKMNPIFGSFSDFIRLMEQNFNKKK